MQKGCRMPSPGAEVSEGCVKVKHGGGHCLPGGVAWASSREQQREDQDFSEGSKSEGSRLWPTADGERRCCC